MCFFNKILEKLGIKKDKKEEAKPTGFATPSTSTGSGKSAASGKATVGGAGVKSAPAKMDTAGPAAAAITEVDVVKQLEVLSKGKDLNWKVSIVDLLKLLDLDSSREAREELAKELNCPADQMSDSARMNVWLHKEVLRQIAANGGNIPADLLD